MADTDKLSTEDVALRQPAPFDQAQGRLRPSSGQVKGLIGLRLLVAVLFLGSAAILAIREQSAFTLTPLFALIAVTCFLSALYVLWLRRTRNVTLLCTLQIWIDSLLVTALVHYTGGIDSLFAFVYIFPVLAAAMLLSRSSSLLLAGWSSLLYGELISIQLRGWPSHPFSATGGMPDSWHALLQVFVNSVAFFLVAILGSHLAERLNAADRELEQQRTGLRNLQTLHQDIVENIPSGVVTLDSTGLVVSLNRSGQRIIGMTADAIQDKSWRETPFEAIEQLETFFVTPAPTFGLSQEVEILGQDGKPCLVGVHFTPLKSSEGRLVGLVGIFQDLTERKKMEARLRQADRLAAVGQLAAGLAHEIRNPLAAISGSVELMKEEGAVQPRLLDVVLSETERLKLVTGQFLDVARPASAWQKTCNLVALVEEAVALLEGRRESGPTVAIAFEKEAEDVMVAGDPDQLKQVFWNLGLSAIAAMPTGGQLSVTIRRHGSTHGGGWAAVELTDTGRKIAPEEIERLFDPFSTTRPGGTGLGLTIARKIIDSLGGRIEVIGREGGGSTFRVLLRQVTGQACVSRRVEAI